MNVAVVGPGAMGCLVAGLLSEAGHDMTLLDYDAVRANTLSEKGIQIESDEGSRHVAVKATADASELGAVELVFFCVKSYQSAAAAGALLGHLDPGAAVVSLQNGCGNLEQIAGAVGVAATVAGITSLGATRLGCGHVRHAGNGPTFLAPRDPAGRPRALLAAKVLTGAGVDVKLVDDWQGMLWSKLVVSAAVNPLTALANTTNSTVIEDAGMNEAMRALVKEAVAVAGSQGIALMFDDAAGEVERICRMTAENVSSMLQDIRAGRPTEIDAINGVIVQRGGDAGIDVPANSVLVEAVHALEKSS